MHTPRTGHFQPICLALLLLGLSVSTLARTNLPHTSLHGLYSLAGTPDSIAEHQTAQSWLLVMIWSTTCAVCIQEIPRYSAYHERYQGTDRSVLGIALDGPENIQAIKAFIKKHDMRFPTLTAEYADFAAQYRLGLGEALRGTPTFLLFAPDGRLAAQQAGMLAPEALDRYIASKTTPMSP